LRSPEETEEAAYLEIVSTERRSGAALGNGAIRFDRIAPAYRVAHADPKSIAPRAVYGREDSGARRK